MGTKANPYLEKFIKVYAGVPIEERKLTVVVIDDQAINWDLAKIYIEGGSELGIRIAKKLIGLKII